MNKKTNHIAKELLLIRLFFIFILQATILYSQVSIQKNNEMSSEVIVKFKHPTINVPDGKVSGSMRAINSNMGSVKDFFSKYSQPVTFDKLVPNAIPNDTIYITPSGEKRKLHDFSQVFIVKFPQPIALWKTIDELKKLPEVEYASPPIHVQSLLSPNDEYYTQANQWYLFTIQAAAAWDITTGNSNYRIALIEKGVAPHSDINTKLVAGESGYTGEHGLNVAGVAGAVTNNGAGIAGLGWNIPLVPMNYNNGSDIAQDILNASNPNLLNHAEIINCSFYTVVIVNNIKYSYNFPSVQDAIENAQTWGALVIAAAGNSQQADEGDTRPFTLWPAAYDGVIGVSATNSSDQFPNGYNYGNFVDVSAPGISILTTVLNNIYNRYDGTSLSTPLVSGLAGLIWSKNPSLTAAQVAATISVSSDDLGSQGWDDHFGNGRINANKALHNLYVPQVYSTIQAASSVATTGQTIIVTGSIGLTANATISSGVTLTIKSGATVNLNSYSIVSTGGTITVESGSSITGATLKTGSTINAIYPTIQSAVNASSSGQRVEISPGTFNENVTINGLSNFTIVGNSINNTTITGTITAYNCPGLYVTSLTCFRMFFNTCNNSYFYGFGVASTSSEVGISHYYCSNFQSSGAVYNSQCGLLAYSGSGYIYSNGNFFYNNTGLYAQASANIMALDSKFCSNITYDLAAIYYGYIEAYNCYYSGRTPKWTQSRGGTVNIYGANDCGYLLKSGSQTANQENIPSANQIQSDDSLSDEFSNINLSYFSAIKNINDAVKENKISDQSKLYNDYKAVINNFKKFMKNHPNSSLARVAFATTANSYWRYNEFDEMKGFLEETISDQKLDQLKGSAERFMIEYYREKKDFNSAINAADAFIKKYENDKELVCDALFGKGLILSYDLKQPEKAADCFSAIVKAYPDNKLAVLAKNELAILGKEIYEIPKENIVAEKVELDISNYPNPFNPSTVVNYQLPEQGHVNIKVYDMLGREVATLVDEVKETGHYSVTFDGSRLSSGVYFLRMNIQPQEGAAFVQVKKMLLTK